MCRKPPRTDSKSFIYKRFCDQKAESGDILIPVPKARKRLCEINLNV